MTAAAGKGRSGPIFLALGLSVSFAIAGTLLTFVLLNLGLNPDAFRYLAAMLLVLVGLLLVLESWAQWLTMQLSKITTHLPLGGTGGSSALGQFGVGMLLGFVWLPCVGPTLGAAIALASVGQDMYVAFVVMLAFGLGTAAALIVVAKLSGAVLSRLRPGLLSNTKSVKKWLGFLLLLLGVLVLTGVDKQLETLAVQYLPDFATAL